MLPPILNVRDSPTAAELFQPVRDAFDAAIEDIDRALEEAASEMAFAVTMKVSKMAAEAADGGLLYSLEGKRALASDINEQCRLRGTTLAHPETGEPCTLLAISDKYEGTFVLENRATKKRSHTTKNIWTLLPLKVIPLSQPE